MRTENRSRTFTEDARRRQIIDGAIDVLHESGFAAASLATIAAHLGVSKGVISYYFEGKDELLREVVASVLADAAEYMRPRIESAGTALEALRSYVTSNLEFIDSHRREIAALTEIVNGIPPGGTEPPPYREGHRQAVDVLTALFTRGQRKREFGKFSAEVAAVSLRASIDAVADLLRDDPAADVTAYGAALLTLFERAVAR